jgi:hypothetical protein
MDSMKAAPMQGTWVVQREMAADLMLANTRVQMEVVDHVEQAVMLSVAANVIAETKGLNTNPCNSKEGSRLLKGTSMT